MAIAALGSSCWRAEVFDSPAARDPGGRSRPTQRYIALDQSDSVSVAEGGNTAITRSILTTCLLAGLIKRFKLEPFALNKDLHGVDAIPDAIFETVDDRLYVVENKAKLYLNEAKVEKCLAVEKIVNAAGLTYLLWTDAWPLSPAVWRLQREMRRLGTAAIAEERIVAVGQAVEQAPLRMDQLRTLGIYREHILSAVWQGAAHLDLFSELTDETLVSNDPQSRGLASTLHASVAAHRWWRGLARV